MSNLVFISGDFSSGTTLLFTLFRNVDGTHCLYEPLHERLLEYLVWTPRAYEGHSFVGDYFREYKGFDEIPQLFDPAWGLSGYHLGAEDEAPELERYLAYLIGSAYGRAPSVVLKDNRFTFRFPWLKRKFPTARIVNIYRERDDQWRSWVRRAQEYTRREDVGQDGVDFMGFRLAAWCEDLAPHYPELAASASTSGYERFSKLWELSRAEHEAHADICVELGELRNDFDGSLGRISAATGVTLDPAALRHLVAPTVEHRAKRSDVRKRLDRLVDRAGMRYAEVRVRARKH